MSNVSTPNPDEPTQGPVISETRAKQGRRGQHTFAILLVSTVLAVVLVFGLWAFSSGGLARVDRADTTSKRAASAHFNAPASQPKAGTTQSTNPT